MSDLISRADAIEAIQNTYCKPCKERGDDYNEVRCRACEYDDAIIQIDALPSAEAVSEDTQTEEQSRFVAKETELAHIEAKLENAEKRLQGACTANFVAEQLDRLRNMTDEERWNFLIRFFSPSADAVEVVRCKECRYFKKIVERSDSGLCYRDLVASVRKENGYCSRGERRET